MTAPTANCRRRAMPPLGQYFSRLQRKKKADDSIAAPKGHGPRTARHFPCMPAVSGGPREGATIAFMDP